MPYKSKSKKYAARKAFLKRNPGKIPVKIISGGEIQTFSIIYIKSKYKMSRSQYNEILRIQSGLCAICREKRVLCVDHCHKTGKMM